MDPERIPVVVGVGQVTHRPDKGMEGLKEPVELMEMAAQRAEEDTGCGGLLRDVDMLCVANILSWGYADPPSRVAEKVRADPRIRWYTGVGACAPQWFVGEVADRIARGGIRTALVCGAESYASLAAARKLGSAPPWKMEGGAPDIVGDKRSPLTEDEQRHQLFVPSHIYALFENAFRYRKGMNLHEHGKELSEFCAAMTCIAKENPNAWFREERKAEDILTVSPSNRMVVYPYTKMMCSMMFVDQSAAVVLMSLAEARRRKIPEDEYIFPVGAGEASDLWYVTHRQHFHESPSARTAAGIALAQADLSMEQVDLIDFYSCFPCVPRIVRDTLGISPDDPRPLTVTGGMPYFGGPGNNYALHAICRMVERLREAPGKTGLVQALSWFLHKHAVGIYRSGDVTQGWERVDPAPYMKEQALLQAPNILDSWDGPATVETYSVVYEGGEPAFGFVVGRTAGEERILARVEDDPDTLQAMITREVVGENGAVRSDASRGFNLFHL